MKNMNRKQKIIVSITGIFIVLLILVGLTYGYFLTRIQGNTNTKSISVTTADLKLTYADGNGIVAPTDKLLPGTTLSSKTFTVKNDGDTKTEYGVIFDKVYNELSRQQDLVYTVTCTSDKGTCNGVSNETIFPNGGGTKENGTGFGIVVTNSIEVGATHSYVLTVKYLEPNVDQSIDMGKTIQGRVTIADMRSLNPYSEDTNTLANAIINNAMTVTSSNKVKGYAEFLPTPKTTPAKEKSLDNEASLSMTTDDEGITYYYRGAVNNNYVNFANKCWRIVRIEGDGSTKLILEDNYATCSSSTGNWTLDTTTSPTISISSWYNSDMKSYESKLKSESICLGDLETKYNSSVFTYSKRIYGGDSSTSTENLSGNKYDYDVFNRLTNGNASLRCYGSKSDASYSYEITADEVAYAGCTSVDFSGYGYAKTYLINDYQKQHVKTNELLTNYNGYNGLLSFRTINVAKNVNNGNYIYRVTGNGALYAARSFSTFDGINMESISDSYSRPRPMVTLKAGTVLASGDGYKTSPYVVN